MRLKGDARVSLPCSERECDPEAGAVRSIE